MEPFHLAIPVTDLDAARTFYGKVLGLAEGRSSDDWVDFDLYGHQLVIHRAAHAMGTGPCGGDVDGKKVPVPHFGVVLTLDRWDALAVRLREHGVTFVIEPQRRYAGQPSEQATMFFRDPCDNALEFKAYADPSQMFAGS